MNPVVIDSGSGFQKAGFAGDDVPKIFYQTMVGRPKHTRVMAGGAVEGDIFIGPQAQELRGLLKMHYPMEHGIVTDWEDMQRIWERLYAELQVNAEDHPVLLTEAPLNPRKNKQLAAQMMFETFNVPAFYTSIQAVLSLYSTGRTNGLVLDSGDGVTHAVPIYEGFSVPSAMRRSDVAGRDVTNHLQLLLRKAGTVFTTSAEKDIVRQIKEKVCYVAAEPRKEEREWTSSANRSVDYRLPDGKVIKLGQERFRAPEILFDPSEIGSEESGIHGLVVESIGRTDLDMRGKLYANVVLSGGSTLTRGRFCAGDRLTRQALGTDCSMNYGAIHPKTPSLKSLHRQNDSMLRGLGGPSLPTWAHFAR